MKKDVNKKEKKSERKKRIVVFLLILVLVTVCAILGNYYGMDPPLLSMIGGYLAVFAVLIITWKMPFSFSVHCMIFLVFAVGLGTLLNFYRTVDAYDKVVHFLSGVLLAEAGLIIGKYLLAKSNIFSPRNILVIFAILFSCMAAGLWEIYEFTSDQVLGTKLQGQNSNTMGDIVSGFLGAILGGVFYFVFGKIKQRKKSAQQEE